MWATKQTAKMVINNVRSDCSAAIFMIHEHTWLRWKMDNDCRRQWNRGENELKMYFGWAVDIRSHLMWWLWWAVECVIPYSHWHYYTSDPRSDSTFSIDLWQWPGMAESSSSVRVYGEYSQLICEYSEESCDSVFRLRNDAIMRC